MVSSLTNFYAHSQLISIACDSTLLVGVVLAAEKKEVSNLFVPTRESGKLYKMDDHIIVSVSGVVADANFLIDYGRLQCQRHLYSHH